MDALTFKAVIVEKLKEELVQLKTEKETAVYHAEMGGSHDTRNVEREYDLPIARLEKDIEIICQASAC